MGSRPPGTISLSEATRRLKLPHWNKIHRLRHQGLLEVYRVGATWCVVERSLEVYQQQQQHPAGTF